ncbi:DUF4181 domain-containing protein [Paenibacillus faecalis]|uniref:DUF4181 domain-containing protein n=1 Tax=Paenibacillus faecalis TaxID=2079532 RepID=UPI000D0F6DEE|nr:DUF4181 domain-containing protein [Paenibacillus faecalis]
MTGFYFFTMIFLILLQFILNKVIVGDEREMSDTTVYRWYLLGSWIIIIPMIVSIWTLDLEQSQPFILFLFMLAFIFRAYMEWRYIRETKRHIVSIISAATSLIFTCILLIL